MNIVNESIILFLDEQLLAEQYLNEKFNINSITDIGKKALIISTVFLTSYGIPIETKDLKQKISNSNIILNLANKNNITKEDVEKTFKKLSSTNLIKYYLIDPNILQDPLTLTTSEYGKRFIKRHEKLKLRAYQIGDGKITVGYGHAEPDSTASYKVGQRISLKEAEKFFIQDLRIAEDGVRRLFKKWNSEGNNIKISQHMWDSMVSMAFNMGVNGFRGSQVIQALKSEDYFKAADLIPITKIKDDFPGIKRRREKEKELFLKDLI